MGGFENATKVCRSRCIRCVTDFSEEEGMCVKKKRSKKYTHEQPPPSSFTLLLLSPLLKYRTSHARAHVVINKQKQNEEES